MKKKPLTHEKDQLSIVKSEPVALFQDIRKLIDETSSTVAAAVNAGLTTLYWKIGKRIYQEILQKDRAEYGAQIVSSLLRQLSWTRFLAVIYMEDPLKRDFYAEMCRIERWSTRTLQKKIDSMLFERTALSTKPEELAKLELQQLREEDKLTPDLVFRDPYFLDFLGLKETYQEKDLESAILREIESFILELGVGFAFLDRQKRITIDGTDYYVDLLFYYRHLRRLVGRRGK